jgi:hypothetical protein
MDEIFSIFREEFGNVIDHRPASALTLDYYKNKLPDQLINHWKKHGWSGYGDGRFWLVNPQEYECVVAAWLNGTPLERLDNYHLFARDAFGTLHLWGERTGPSLTITSIYSQYNFDDLELTSQDRENDFQHFLLVQDKESSDFCDCFEKTMKRLGTLAHDEMYGFVPAVLLGGSDDPDHLQKVKVIEHLTLLAQLETLRPYGFSDPLPL